MTQSIQSTALIIAIAMTSLAPVYGQMDHLHLPSRPTGATGGAQFIEQIKNLPRDERETVIYNEVTSGNVPDFMRRFQAVTVPPAQGNAAPDGQSASSVIYVTPDYLAVGSDTDHVRIPMTPLLAQRIADATSTTLPTRKMVDAIWAAAPCKLTPSPIPPSAAMITVPVFLYHHQIVQAQRSAQLQPLGELVAGHKKDLVITPRLHDSTTSKRVAIYGWHQPDGIPIQNLYLGHEETYADYSHGIRVVNNQMLLHGKPANVRDVLTSPATGALLNDEATSFTTSIPPRYRTSHAIE